MVKSVVLFGTLWCGDCRRAESFLQSKGVGFEKINIDEDKQAAERVVNITGGKKIVPTLVLRFLDGREEVMVNPSIKDLSNMLGDCFVEP